MVHLLDYGIIGFFESMFYDSGFPQQSESIPGWVLEL